MTIDERLDRLTERDEALAQSTELLLAAQRENAGQIAVLTERMGGLTERMTSLTAHVETLTGSMLVVSQLLQSHENRLDKLEG